MGRASGFTLLEVMVALAVFATLATAVLSASQYVIKQAGVVEERLMAAWVADNYLNERRLQSAATLGPVEQSVVMDRREWQIRQRSVNAREPRWVEVEIEVGLVDRDQVLHRRSGWIARHHE